MLTKSGKIVFSIGFFGIILLVLVVFLKSSPDDSFEYVHEDILVSEFEPNSQMLDRVNVLLSDISSDVETVESRVHLSNDGHFALFQGGVGKVEGQVESGSVVVLLDIKEGTLKKIYDGLLVGEPSWSTNFVSFSSDGIYVYNLNGGNLVTVSYSGSHSVVSPDERFVAYEDKGIHIFSLLTNAATVLTQDSSDKIGTWMNDSLHIAIFRSNGRELGDGAGMAMDLFVIDTATKDTRKITSVPSGLFSKATYFNNSLFVSAGFDDGRSDYLVNTEKNSIVIVNDRVSVSDVVVDINKNHLLVYTNSEVMLYDSNGVVTSRIPISLNTSSTPVWIKGNESFLWIGYTATDASVVTIRKWNIQTKEMEDEFSVQGDFPFSFSDSLVYATSSLDHMKLLVNILK